MDIWKTLGISKTDDEEEIKKAYLEQLAFHHPEEDPDGFMQLREAFEQAVRQIGREEEEEQEQINPEIRPWVDRMKALYGEYGRRIRREEWEELLKDPLCIGLETGDEINQALLAFLMDHVYIPHTVWKFLAEQMGWFENRSALCQSFPENFIDYVLNQATYPDNFRYDGFELEPGKDYDQFIRGYFNLNAAIRDEKEEEASSILRGMLDMDIEHPDFSVIQVKYYTLIRKDPEAAWNLAGAIRREEGERAEEWELYWYVKAGLGVHRAEEVKPFLDRLILLDGDNPAVMKLAGDYYASLGECQTALLCYDRAADLDKDGDSELDEARDRMYEFLSHRLERELEMKPSEKLRWRTGRACYFGGRYDVARQILESIENIAGREERLYWWLADSCFELRDYEAAEEYCDKVLERSPVSSDALPLKVRLLSMREADEELIRVVEAALEKDYKSVSVIYNYAQALRRSEDYEKAGQYLGMLEEQMGKHPVLMTEFARLRYAMEQYEEALEYVDSVLENQPENEDCLYLKAHILRDMERYEEALDIYMTQEKRGRADSYDYYKVGYLYYCMKQYENAEIYYKKAIEDDPKNYAAFNELGDTYQKMGRMEEAADAYRGALKKENPSARWFWDLIRLLRRMNRCEESLKLCKEGMERFPKDYRFYNMAGQNAERLDLYEEAIEYYRMDGELDVKNEDAGQQALKNIGDCYEGMEQYDKAEEYYRRGTEEFPEKAAAWQALGVFYMENKEAYREALEYFKKAYEIDKESSYRLICMGRCHEALGETEEARAFFLESLQAAEKRIQKNPSSPCAYEAAAEAYSYLGETDKAVEMAKKALEFHLEYFGCPRLNCYEACQDMGRAQEKAGQTEAAAKSYMLAWEYGQKEEDLETARRLGGLSER